MAVVVVAMAATSIVVDVRACPSFAQCMLIFLVMVNHCRRSPFFRCAKD